jgi:holo-[acyl-carrier protein] synthase
MILGIGVDILYLPRITSLASRRGKEKLAKRILSTKELSEFNQLKSAHDHNHIMYLATRYLYIINIIHPILKVE